MNRNVSIVVIILVLVVIAGYLVWLRSRVAPVTSPVMEQVQVTPSAEATLSSSPTASPAASVATGSARTRTASPSATRR